MLVARRREPDTRQRILSVVARLFGQYGVRAVGMQHVADETGTGKSLLYREFASKEDLIVAWLRENRAAWRSALDAAVGQHDGDPARQLLAVVEAAHSDVLAPAYRGCVFHNTCTEFPDPAHRGHQESVAQIHYVRARLRTLAVVAGAADPTALADALMLVIEGINTSGAVLGAAGPARLGVPIATALIRQHCPTSTHPAGPHRSTVPDAGDRDTPG
jgi:AcrR family transcriptional regulator